MTREELFDKHEEKIVNIVETIFFVSISYILVNFVRDVFANKHKMGLLKNIT